MAQGLAQQQQESKDEPSPEPISDGPLKTEQEPATFDIPEDSRPASIGCAVHCTFRTTVKTGTTKEAIEAELRKVMAKAGITTLQTVTVEFDGGNQ